MYLEHLLMIACTSFNLHFNCRKTDPSHRWLFKEVNEGSGIILEHRPLAGGGWASEDSRVLP